MRKTKYQKQLDDIRNQALDEIWKIFNKNQVDGELNIAYGDDDVDEGEGIGLDYVRYREDSWEQYNDEIIAMDKDGELYTEWDIQLSIHDFNACELVRFLEELKSIFK